MCSFLKPQISYSIPVSQDFQERGSQHHALSAFIHSAAILLSTRVILIVTPALYMKKINIQIL